MTRYVSISSENLLHGLMDLQGYTFVKNGCIIRFKEHVSTKRYHPKLTEADRQIFHSNSEILWDELLRLLNYGPETCIYVSSYEGNWQPGILFDSDKLSEGQYVMQTNHTEVLREIFYMSLEHRTFPVFVSADRLVAVIPTDHLDMFIAYSDPHKISSHMISEDLERIEWQQQ